MSQERPSAVRFFAPDHPQLAITVRTRLEKLRAEQLENLARKMESADHNWYAGIVNGIEMALQLCLEAENEMRERN